MRFARSFRLAGERDPGSGPARRAPSARSARGPRRRARQDRRARADNSFFSSLHMHGTSSSRCVRHGSPALRNGRCLPHGGWSSRRGRLRQRVGRRAPLHGRPKTNSCYCIKQHGGTAENAVSAIDRRSTLKHKAPPAAAQGLTDGYPYRGATPVIQRVSHRDFELVSSARN